MEKFIYFRNSTQILKLVVSIFGSFNCDDFGSPLTKTHQSLQIRIWWHANQLINSKHLQRFPEPSKWSQFGSLGYTIMGKTADLTIVQKTIIDTLHKEGKPQTWIAKEAGCSQSAVSKHANRKVEGKVWKKKMQKPTERTAALWGLSSKIDSRIWMNFTRNGLRLGSRHQESPHRCVKEFGYSCHQRRLNWAKEKKNCCPVVQSPIFRWEQVLYFIWKPRS